MNDNIRNSKGAIFFICAFFVITMLFAANLAVGAVRIPIGEILKILAGGGKNDVLRFIIIESRLPQAITAILCGASLAVCGLMLQTSFRNPLAGPSIFGINSGASLGVAIVILLFNGSISTQMLTVSGFAAIIAGAFIGASVIILLLLFFSKTIRSNTALLIVGIMIGYVSSAAISILNFFATDQGVTAYVMWGMGNFSSVSMQHIPVFVTTTMVCLLLSMLLIKPLNALLLGERYAVNLGFNTNHVRMWLLLLTGLQTAVTTAYCGPVAFIGLAVPHITRMFLTTDDHSIMMPGTALTGSAIALLCNVICTLSPNGSIIPLNAVTSLVGAPVIVYVVMKHRGKA